MLALVLRLELLHHGWRLIALDELLENLVEQLDDQRLILSGLVLHQINRKAVHELLIQAAVRVVDVDYPLDGIHQEHLDLFVLGFEEDADDLRLNRVSESFLQGAVVVFQELFEVNGHEQVILGVRGQNLKESLIELKLRDARREVLLCLFPDFPAARN